jgi:hypothetical protein
MTRPFLVQAYTHRQSANWVTDSRHETEAEATAAAERLRVEWGRTVRVVNQDERVLWRAGTYREAARKP